MPDPVGQGPDDVERIVLGLHVEEVGDHTDALQVESVEERHGLLIVWTTFVSSWFSGSSTMRRSCSAPMSRAVRTTRAKRSSA